MAKDERLKVMGGRLKKYRVAANSSFFILHSSLKVLPLQP
jgi:hypothetical protein